MIFLDVNYLPDFLPCLSHLCTVCINYLCDKNRTKIHGAIEIVVILPRHATLRCRPSLPESKWAPPPVVSW